MTEIIHEFPRPLAIDGVIADKPRAEKMAATADECAALAKRFDLRHLENFKANMTVLRVSEGRMIRVKGSLSADVVQSCVVSLRDVPAHIQGEFDTYFNEDGKNIDQDGEFSIEIEEEISDVLKDGVLDLGELAAQYLALELDPYPRAPGVSLAAQMAEVGGDKKNRPFEVLQSLKDKKGE
jgi:uncharacterized metal-binding protein YceD (DUF177 family)